MQDWWFEVHWAVIEVPPMDARNMVVLFADPVVIAPAFCTTLTVLKFMPADTHVTVFCVDFSDEKYQTTVGVFSAFGPSVSLQQVDSTADFDDCIWRTSLGLATWGRLFLDKLLPRDLDACLVPGLRYLVQSDLAPLLNADLGTNPRRCVQGPVPVHVWRCPTSQDGVGSVTGRRLFQCRRHVV